MATTRKGLLSAPSQPRALNYSDFWSKLISRTTTGLRSCAAPPQRAARCPWVPRVPAALSDGGLTPMGAGGAPPVSPAQPFREAALFAPCCFSEPAI